MKHDSRAGVLVMRFAGEMPAYACNLVCVCCSALNTVACKMHGWFNAVELLVLSKDGRECMTFRMLSGIWHARVEFSLE